MAEPFPRPPLPPKGSRVKVTTLRPPATGTVRFVGPTALGVGTWVGVELDEERQGLGDGRDTDGVRRFACGAGRGAFLRPGATKIIALPTETLAELHSEVLPEHAPHESDDDAPRPPPRSPPAAWLPVRQPTVPRGPALQTTGRSEGRGLSPRSDGPGSPVRPASPGRTRREGEAWLGHLRRAEAAHEERAEFSAQERSVLPFCLSPAPRFKDRRGTARGARPGAEAARAWPTAGPSLEMELPQGATEARAGGANAAALAQQVEQAAAEEAAAEGTTVQPPAPQAAAAAAAGGEVREPSGAREARAAACGGAAAAAIAAEDEGPEEEVARLRARLLEEAQGRGVLEEALSEAWRSLVEIRRLQEAQQARVAELRAERGQLRAWRLQQSAFEPPAPSPVPLAPARVMSKS